MDDVRTPMQHIKAEDCKDGGLYRIWSRNLRFGVYRKETRGFVGIREKFGHLYLFEEYHWDNGPPFGTVKPREFLEDCTVQPISCHLEKPESKFENNKVLFDWLTQKEEQYKERPNGPADTTQ
jgi:hypothetical protein